MGFLDNIKNALGGKKEDKADVTVGPSQVLRDNGIDPSGLDFGFNSDGSVTVKGTAASERERQRILEIVGGIKGVKGVKDNLRVAPASAQPEVPVIPAAPEPEVSSAPDPEPATDDRGQKTYTVQPGDTLWKIAEAHYGEGSKYTRIFEANRPMLEDPDKIFPGQELVIPREEG